VAHDDDAVFDWYPFFSCVCCFVQRRVHELSAEWGVGFGSVAGRVLVKEGCLTKTDRRGKEEVLTFLLFNDLIVYGDTVKARV